MPDASGSPIIGDLITADDAAVSDQAAKQQAVNDTNAALSRATADLTASNGTVTVADAALAAGLGKVGPTFTIDTDGRVTVFEPDSSPRGFHSFRPSPATASIPAPAPATVNPN